MIVGTGVDVEEVSRVEASIERHGERFLKRVYSRDEIEYVEQKANRFERYAARFAAKEAAMKALGTGWDCGVAWRDIEVVNEPSGRPTLRLGGGAQKRAEELGAKRSHVTLSHTRGLVVAQVILEG